MKILVITNFYPPNIGGYAQQCQEIVDGLIERGHDLLVLTSIHNKSEFSNVNDSWVRRELHLEMGLVPLWNAVHFFINRREYEHQNIKILSAVVDTFEPDVIFIWGMWNMNRSLPAIAEKLMQGRVVYYLGDYWPTLPNQFLSYWNAPARNLVTFLPKVLLKPFALRILMQEKIYDLRLDNVMFASKFMLGEYRRLGINPRNPKIVYGAINTKPYLDRNKSLRKRSGISLLYVGRLTQEKGVHTAIAAIKQLLMKPELPEFRLTIVGDGDPRYVKELHEIADDLKVSSYVKFLPAQKKESMPTIYHQSDILLFTSIWAEPFGRVIIEAMASGVAVVGTAVGGASEILVENENALLFSPNDPVSLGQQLYRLIMSPSLRENLIKTGYQDAVGKYDIQRMTLEIETFLQSLHL